MTDLDTANYLLEFKSSYVGPIKSAIDNLVDFGEDKLTEEQKAKLTKLRKQYSFLTGFCDSIQGTLEQNVVLKTSVNYSNN